jgi:hypothetical protein
MTSSTVMMCPQMTGFVDDRQRQSSFGHQARCFLDP